MITTTFLSSNATILKTLMSSSKALKKWTLESLQLGFVRSHESYQVYLCLISVSSLVMFLKYNSDSDNDYFKCFLIVLHISWLYMYMDMDMDMYSLHRVFVLGLASTLVPYSPPCFYLWPFVTMESLPIEFYFIFCLYTLVYMNFQSGLLSLHPYPLHFFFWSGNSHIFFFTYLPKFHILHTSLLLR